MSPINKKQQLMKSFWSPDADIMYHRDSHEEEKLKTKQISEQTVKNVLQSNDQWGKKTFESPRRSQTH